MFICQRALSSRNRVLFRWLAKLIEFVLFYCYHKFQLRCIYSHIIATDDVIGKCISGDEGDINDAKK